MYPVLVDLGFWQLRSYGVFVAAAILVGVWWSAREAERRGFYELLGYGLVFLGVQRVACTTARAGAAMLTYAVLYGAVRFVMEFFRGDPPMVAGIVLPQALSVLLAGAGAIGFWWLWRKNWKARESLAA